ncbi:DUF5333 family protein [Ruegeria sp.]|uniref:DUF5333 family protein n=1 Tax=Ruegeria sp. TaxID=1879320 RepID=UPI0023269D74|nr:DUF5333 family protein [Ruegeria sp.]MDA7963066.1 DUF5333 domain-containing protein [Ruegeria sp.]
MLIALSGCDVPTPEERRQQAERALDARVVIPAERKQYEQAQFAAAQIAGRCKSLSYSRRYAEKADQEIAAKYPVELDEDGTSPDSVTLKEYLENTVAEGREYWKKIGLPQGDNNSEEVYCAVGQREIANGTQLGAFLRRK